MSSATTSTGSATRTDSGTLPNPPGFCWLRVGDVECVAVSEGDAGAPPGGGPLIAGTPPEEVFGLLRAHGGGRQEPRISVTALALRRGHRTTLIDSGFGIFNTPDGLNRPGQVQPNLAAAGIASEDVDLVIISHPHGDHVGGLLTPEGELTYPNARYVLPRREWQFWIESEPDLSSALIPDGFKQAMKMQARTVLPRLEGRIDLAEPGEEVEPGMRLLATPGHTHGMVGVEIDGGGQRLLYLADVFMHPVLSIKRPGWRVPMDLDGKASEATRHELLERVASSGELCFCTHFPWPALGWVVERDGEHHWTPLDWRWWS